MNAANAVTLGRLALSVVLFVLLWRTGIEPYPGWVWFLSATLLFIIAAATDYLDGYLARKYDQVTDFGRIADPAVDKIIICGTLIFLTSAPWSRPLVPAWVVVVVVGREFMVTGIRGFLEARGIPFPADWAGKFKMGVQCVAIPGVLVHEICRRHIEVLSEVSYWLAVVLVGATVILTLYSGINYVRSAANLLRRDSK